MSQQTKEYFFQFLHYAETTPECLSAKWQRPYEGYQGLWYPPRADVRLAAAAAGGAAGGGWWQRHSGLKQG